MSASILRYARIITRFGDIALNSACRGDDFRTLWVFVVAGFVRLCSNAAGVESKYRGRSRQVHVPIDVAFGA